MSRTDKNAKKLAVLEVVKNKKDILFASFQNNAASKKEKEEAWDEVLLKAKSLGLATANRKWTFARDNLFGLWKSRMLAKRDNSKKTGTGGGRAFVLDAVDEAILDIIGKDSPVAEGINLPEAGGDGFDSPPSEQTLPATSSSGESKSSSRKRKVEAEEELIALKKQLLKIEIYKASLEAYKLEREFGLPESEFTKYLNENDSHGKDQNSCSRVGKVLNLSEY